MTTPTDPQALGKLRQLAEKATPGEWHIIDGRIDGTAIGSEVGGWITSTSMRPDDPDLAFIAAANPQAILALLDRVERAERERDEARTGSAHSLKLATATNARAAGLQARLDAAEARLAGARKVREAVEKSKDFLSDTDLDAEDAANKAYLALVNAYVPTDAGQQMGEGL